MTSALFAAVAVYEKALADERAAWAAFNEGTAAAESEVAGHFELRRGAGVVWVPPLEEGHLADDYLTTHPRCPPQPARVAQDYTLGALAEAVEATGDEWLRASEAMLATPCADRRDMLEKLRALTLEADHFVTTRAVDGVFDAIEQVLAEAGGGRSVGLAA